MQTRYHGLYCYLFILKVVLTKQLSEATSQISGLQMEVSSLKKKEFELTQQMENSGKSSRRQSEELETLKTQHSGETGFTSSVFIFWNVLFF